MQEVAVLQKEEKEMRKYLLWVLVLTAATAHAQTITFNEYVVKRCDAYIADYGPRVAAIMYAVIIGEGITRGLRYETPLNKATTAPGDEAIAALAVYVVKALAEISDVYTLLKRLSHEINASYPDMLQIYNAYCGRLVNAL